MLDLRLRPTKERIVGPVAGLVARRASANALSALALAAALGAAGSAAAGRPLAALAAWLVSRLLDGLDGPVARVRGEGSDLGGYLDMVGDTIGYAAIPLGVAAGVDEAGTWIAVAVLQATFFVNAISWTYLAAVAEKRGSGAAERGELTAITMPPALVEGTETIVIFSIFLAVPAWAEPAFWAMAGLVTLNVVQRVLWARRHLAST